MTYQTTGIIEGIIVGNDTSEDIRKIQDAIFKEGFVCTIMNSKISILKYEEMK